MWKTMMQRQKILFHNKNFISYSEMKAVMH